MQGRSAEGTRRHASMTWLSSLLLLQKCSRSREKVRTVMRVGSMTVLIKGHSIGGALGVAKHVWRCSMRMQAEAVTCSALSTTPSSCQGRLALRATVVYAPDISTAQSHMRAPYGSRCNLRAMH